MGKVPEYTRKAISKYRDSKYNVSVTLPAEYKDLIARAGFSGNGFINMAVKNELIRRGLIEDDVE